MCGRGATRTTAVEQRYAPRGAVHRQACTVGLAHMAHAACVGLRGVVSPHLLPHTSLVHVRACNTTHLLTTYSGLQRCPAAASTSTRAEAPFGLASLCEYRGLLLYSSPFRAFCPSLHHATISKQPTRVVGLQLYFQDNLQFGHTINLTLYPPQHTIHSSLDFPKN